MSYPRIIAAVVTLGLLCPSVAAAYDGRGDAKAWRDYVDLPRTLHSLGGGTSVHTMRDPGRLIGASGNDVEAAAVGCDVYVARWLAVLTLDRTAVVAGPRGSTPVRVYVRRLITSVRALTCPLTASYPAATMSSSSK